MGMQLIVDRLETVVKIDLGEPLKDKEAKVTEDDQVAELGFTFRGVTLQLRVKIALICREESAYYSISASHDCQTPKHFVLT